MKYMVHMINEEYTGFKRGETKEVLLFGGDLMEIRTGEDYKDFIAEGLVEQGAYEVEFISGEETLPVSITC